MHILVYRLLPSIRPLRLTRRGVGSNEKGYVLDARAAMGKALVNLNQSVRNPLWLKEGADCVFPQAALHDMERGQGMIGLSLRLSRGGQRAARWRVCIGQVTHG